MQIKSLEELHAGQYLFKFGRLSNNTPHLSISRITSVETVPGPGKKPKTVVVEQFINFRREGKNKGEWLDQHTVRNINGLACTFKTRREALDSGITKVLSRIGVTEFGSDTPGDRLLREIFYKCGDVKVTASMLRDVIEDLGAILKIYEKVESDSSMKDEEKEGVKECSQSNS